MFVNKIAYDPVGYVSYKDYMFMASKLNYRLQTMIRYDRLEQAAMTEDAETAARLVAEAGWPNMAGMTAEQIDEVLNARRISIFRDIEQVCPEEQVVQMMRLKYDYSNIKALVKGDGAGISPEEAFIGAGRFAPEKLKEDFLNNDYRDLPSLMAETIRDAREMMARTQNPTAVDLYIDRMYFRELFEMALELEPKVEPETPMMAPEPGEHYAIDLIRKMIDRSNLMTCVRVMRMGRSQEYLKSVLIEDGHYPPDQLAAAAAGGDGLAGLFKDTYLYDAALSGQDALHGGPITKFEKDCAESWLKYLANLRKMYFDARAVIWYLTAVDANILNVRMLLTGLLAGVSAEKLKERLRETYV